MDWIFLPGDRGSMNGRPVLFVRERTAAGAGGEAVAALFMNKTSEPGLLDAEAHAKMTALVPRYAAFIRSLFENAATIPPDERSSALQEAVNLHVELTGEPDRYRYVEGEAGPSVVETVDEEAAA